MIFLVALAFALIWTFHNMVRANKISAMEAEARAERAIVQSLFPSNVRDRLIEDAERKNEFPLKKPASTDLHTSEGIFGSKPIADFFPEVTIMFADISGFTAWASTREPVSETPAEISRLSTSTALFVAYSNLHLSSLSLI